MGLIVPAPQAHVAQGTERFATNEEVRGFNSLRGYMDCEHKILVQSSVLFCKDCSDILADPAPGVRVIRSYKIMDYFREQHDKLGKHG